MSMAWKWIWTVYIIFFLMWTPPAVGSVATAAETRKRRPTLSTISGVGRSLGQRRRRRRPVGKFDPQTKVTSMSQRARRPLRLFWTNPHGPVVFSASKKTRKKPTHAHTHTHTGFYWVFLVCLFIFYDFFMRSYLDFTRFYLVLLGFTRFY